jgi:hypothetical protein
MHACVAQKSSGGVGGSSGGVTDGGTAGGAGGGTGGGATGAGGGGGNGTLSSVRKTRTFRVDPPTTRLARHVPGDLLSTATLIEEKMRVPVWSERRVWLVQTARTVPAGSFHSILIGCLGCGGVLQTKFA